MSQDQKYAHLYQMAKRLPGSPRSRTVASAKSRTAANNDDQSLEDAMTQTTVMLKRAQMPGVETWDNVLKASGMMQNIDSGQFDGQARSLVVVVPDDGYFAAGKGRVKATESDRKTLLDDGAENQPILEEIVRGHIGEGVDDLKEVLLGQADVSAEMTTASGKSLSHYDEEQDRQQARSVDTLFETSSADEGLSDVGTDEEDETAGFSTRAPLSMRLSFHGPRVKQQHFNMAAKPDDSPTGLLDFEDMDQGVVLAKGRVSLDGGGWRDVPFAQAKVQHVKRFDRGHIVVVDRLLTKPNVVTEAPAASSSAK